MPRKTPYSDYAGRVNNEPSRTKQDAEPEANIRNILKKYRQTGNITHLSRAVPIYGDFSQVGDLQSAIARVEAAGEAWSHVPAAIRREFRQDAQAFIGFMDSVEAGDPAAKARAVELGILNKPEEPLPTVQEVLAEVRDVIHSSPPAHVQPSAGSSEPASAPAAEPPSTP